MVFTSDELDGICGGCGSDATMIDALGLEWCPECKQRGELVNWGAAHNWQTLEIHPYAIAEGVYNYAIVAAIGCDDEIWLMLGLTEMLDQAEQATQNALQSLV